MSRLITTPPAVKLIGPLSLISLYLHFYHYPAVLHLLLWTQMLAINHHLNLTIWESPCLKERSSTFLQRSRCLSKYWFAQWGIVWLHFLLTLDQHGHLGNCVLSAGAASSLLLTSTPTSNVLTTEGSVVVDPGQETEVIAGLVTSIADTLKENQLRMISESEIGYSILYVSTSQYCNTAAEAGEFWAWKCTTLFRCCGRSVAGSHSVCLCTAWIHSFT